MSFYQLLMSRQWEKAQILISEDPSLVDMTFSDGKTILMKSLDEDSPCMMKFLLDNGAEVNMQDKQGYTVMMRLLSKFHSYPKKLFLNYLTCLVQFKIENYENNYGYDIPAIISFDTNLQRFFAEISQTRNEENEDE